jgi:hypothetical protein
MDDSKVQIIKVANGYLVRPIYDRGDGIDRTNEMRVFETFEALVVWLRDNFEGRATA